MKIQEMFLETGLCKSKNEFNRLVKQGGARVFDQKISDPEAHIYIVNETFALVDGQNIRYFDKGGAELFFADQ